MKRRAQTATEYLIILAVVIVIALIVVGVMGGIPSIGGGASESASRAALSSAEVGITGYSISPAKGFFRLQNNQANAITVDSITIDGKVCWIIGSNSQPSLTPRLRAGETKTISCGSITAESGDRYDYELSLTYTDTSTNAQYTITDLQMVGSGASFDCPTGFIPVPGGFVLADGSTVDDFCVMKYEAREDSSGECIGGNSDNCPVSVAAGTPWTNINWYNATEECQSLGSGYDLISDQQWMVLAENILNTPINDLNGSASGPQLATGHSDNSPSGAQVSLATEDPVVTGCDLNQPADASANAYVEGSCEIQGSGINSKGYYNTEDAFTDAYNPPASGGRGQMRTHILSNGEVIWDMPGNVYEWTKENYSAAVINGGEYTSGLDFTGISWVQPSQLLSISNGAGSFYVGLGGNVAQRGGLYGQVDIAAGVFSIIDGAAPSLAHTSFGFRCVYSPGG